MLDITNIGSHARVGLHVDFTGAAPIPAQYAQGTFEPQRLGLEYVRTFNGEAWIWRCTAAELTGPRLLAPGPDGAKRLGKQTRKHEWHVFGTRDVADGDTRLNTHPLPKWLEHLIHELRPAGGLALAGE